MMVETNVTPQIHCRYSHRVANTLPIFSQGGMQLLEIQPTGSIRASYTTFIHVVHMFNTNIFVR